MSHPCAHDRGAYGAIPLMAPMAAVLSGYRAPRSGGAHDTEAVAAPAAGAFGFAWLLAVTHDFNLRPAHPGRKRHPGRPCTAGAGKRQVLTRTTHGG
jgi:hypothetical protein